jgi:hypothetical protein
LTGGPRLGGPGRVHSNDLMTTAVEIGLIGAIAVLLIAPLAARIIRGKFDVFEPIVFFAVGYGVMFVARPASMVASHHLAYDGPRVSTDVSGTFAEMLVIALLGAIAFIVGYETSLGSRLANRWRGLGNLTGQSLVRASFVTAAVGIVSFLVLIIHAGGFSGFTLLLRGRTAELSSSVEQTSFYLWYSSFLLVPATVTLLATGLERRRKVLIFAAVAFGAVFLLRTVPVGARIAILPLIGGVFVLYYLRRAIRPSWLTLAAVVLIALVGSSFLSDLRGRGTRGEGIVETAVRATQPERVLSPLRTGPDSEMAPVLAAGLTRIPENLHYTYGRTIFGDLVSRPIPRSLWNEKPVPPREKLIADLWPIERRQGGINPEFSVLLYFFWDFGISGVLVGMFIFGVAARALFAYFLNYSRSAAVQVLYSLAVWFVVIGLRNSPVDTLILFMFIVFPAWLVVRISLSRRAQFATPVPR